MDRTSSRAGKGVANPETSGWKSAKSRKEIAKTIANAIFGTWHPLVECNMSQVMTLAEILEGQDFASAKDEDDYKLKVSRRMMTIDTSLVVHRPKLLATSSNQSEAAILSGSKGRGENIDWQEVVYERVQRLKSSFLPLLSDIYQRVIFKILWHSSPQTESPTVLEKCAMKKRLLEEIFECLTVTKNQIGPDFMSKLLEKEKHIGAYLRAAKEYRDRMRLHSTERSSAQQAVLSLRLQNSQLSEQIPNQNNNSQNEAPLYADTFDQPTPAIQRLAEAASSMSHESLSKCVSKMIDIIGLSNILLAPFERAKDVVCSDSVVDLSADSQAGYSIFGDFIKGDGKISRSHNAIPLYTASLYASTSESLNPLIDADESDLNSIRSQVKWPTDEEKHALLEEIEGVKKFLFDTKVVINEAETVPSAAAGASELGDGLIVKLCFTAQTMTSDLKSLLVCDQTSIFNPFRLLIPTSYPRCSPILLDEMPSESRNEPDDVLTKAKLKLQRYLRCLTNPFSIQGIILSWETCVREAICDYAKKFGGGTFTSKYGAWEKC